MSNQQIAVTIQQALVDGFKNFSDEFLNDCGNLGLTVSSAAAGGLPLNFGNPVYGQKNPVFVDFMIPGTIILIIFLLAIGITIRCNL